MEVKQANESKQEHVGERQYNDYSEIYTPIKDSTGRILGVVETYQVASDLITAEHAKFANFAWITVFISLGVSLGTFLFARLIRYLRLAR